MKVKIKDNVSVDLAFRDTARSFYGYLEKLADNYIEIDFKDVQSISRSFAQEYLVLKKTSRKHITEKNLPANVKKMFGIVNENKTKPRLIHLETMKVLSL
ncbi:DUF4325 domain-containing protein [Candidatus Micrarchaeota archaeon]|nr:DUF4325 domain-containing protein [Candidatus Micrarchaeota archaeon]